MEIYIVNRNKNDKGSHEVHTTVPRLCNKTPALIDHVPLGLHPSYNSAVTKAKDLGYSPADGCDHCTYESLNG